MSERLPAHVEVAAVMRRAEAEGGFATLLRKGDPDRGAVTLVLEKRGEFCGILERELGPSFDYEWVFKPAGSESVADFIARRERFDTDFWLIELDIAAPERFIAETTSLG
ncbi:MAG TPA: DUF1491 family protein [Sphingomicrobium sp.]